MLSCLRLFVAGVHGTPTGRQKRAHNTVDNGKKQRISHDTTTTMKQDVYYIYSIVRVRHLNATVTALGILCWRMDMNCVTQSTLERRSRVHKQTDRQSENTECYKEPDTSERNITAKTILFVRVSWSGELLALELLGRSQPRRSACSRGQIDSEEVCKRV